MGYLDACDALPSTPESTVSDRKSESRRRTRAASHERAGRLLYDPFSSSVVGLFRSRFERGFSFYWCTKAFGLLAAVAWALRQIGVRSYLLAIFGAVWVMFSSYVQWWFSSPGMLPEMITTWAICLGCAVSFFQDQHRGKLTLALASFIFCGTNFVLCLYPPYQIPLTLLMLAILIGVWLENCDKQDSKSTIRGLILIGTGLLAIAVILIPYWINVR